MAFPLADIYRPTHKDVVSGLQPLRAFGLFSNAAATPTVVATTTLQVVPPDRMLIIQMISWLATAGAAQFLELGFLSVFPGGSVAANYAVDQSPPTRNAAVAVAMSWSGEIWLYPSDTFQLGAVFNAGVASNSIQASYFGWSLPRANFN